MTLQSNKSLSLGLSVAPLTGPFLSARDRLTGLTCRLSSVRLGRFPWFVDAVVAAVEERAARRGEEAMRQIAAALDSRRPRSFSGCSPPHTHNTASIPFHHTGSQEIVPLFFHLHLSFSGCFHPPAAHVYICLNNAYSQTTSTTSCSFFSK